MLVGRTGVPCAMLVGATACALQVTASLQRDPPAEASRAPCLLVGVQRGSLGCSQKARRRGWYLSAGGGRGGAGAAARERRRRRGRRGGGGGPGRRAESAARRGWSTPWR